MTPRERIIAALKGLPTDRVPYLEVFFSNREVAEYFGGPQNTFEDAVRYVANSEQCSILVAGFWWCPADNYKNTVGGERRYSGGKRWTLDDVLSMQEPDIEPQFSILQKNIASARARDIACQVFLMNGFHSASTAMSLENLCYAIFDNPEVVHGYIKRIEEFNRKVLKRLADFDIDVIFFDGDCAYKTGLMISPKIFKDIWLEQTRQTVNVCHENGWLSCYHTDGKIDEVYPLLIELGFNGTHGVEAAANDLADIKMRFGKNITLIGNFDVVDMATLTPEHIARKTREMIRTGNKGGRYVAACNTLVGDNITLANYLAFQKTVIGAIC